jgi:diaminopropionate ammonia-lyase
LNWTIRLCHNARAAKRAEYGFRDVLSASNSERAYETIRRWQGYQPTPRLELPGLADSIGIRRVLYKNEAARFGLGSFKALGGTYAVGELLQSLLGRQLGRPVSIDDLETRAYLKLTQRITVACASDGNHGRAVAAGAKRFGCRCTVFLHDGVSRGREQAITDLGASVVRVRGNYDDSVCAAEANCKTNHWYPIADTSTDSSDPTPRVVMSGYATIVIETLAQARSAGIELPTHVFLQGGVGGLAAAVIAY